MFFKYKGINIEGDLQQNLIVKAYNILKKYYPQIPNVNVTLTKIFLRKPAWVEVRQIVHIQ